MTPAALLAARVHPCARHLIASDALLDDLLDEIDIWGLRDDLEHALGREISDAEMERWKTVGDVERVRGRVVA